MASILSLPAEVHTQILGNLDIHSTLALACTCKELNATIKNNQQTIAKHIAANIMLEETGYVGPAAVKLAFMALEAQRIRKERDIDTLLAFEESFVGAAADAKKWLKMAGRVATLMRFIHGQVIPNLICFPIEDPTKRLTFEEKGRMIRAILAVEAVCNLAQCIQGNHDTPWSNSIRLSHKFWLQFSRHEAKQMDGIMAGIQAIRESTRCNSTLPAPPAVILDQKQKTLLCLQPSTSSVVLMCVRDALSDAHQLVAVVRPHEPFPAFAPEAPRSAIANRNIPELRHKVVDRFNPFVWCIPGRSTIVHIMDEHRFARIMATRVAWEARRGFYMGRHDILYFEFVSPPVEAWVVANMGGYRRFSYLLPTLEKTLMNGLGLR
ncbi:hypothetical protein F4775DRAFT_605364 [Biscogniauxia sp. FL1348]|nr:hypothetical protein F4775DRAFT_605364 [Biscogniauxia sp. FL1348]